MAIEPEALSNPLQPRFESISMRLDAATDTLLQTRDLLIRHLEHQMLQLDEVRKALHEASKEASQWVADVHRSTQPKTANAAPPPLQPANGAEREFTLESLFAPLNAAPPRPAAPAPLPTIPAIQGKEELAPELVSAVSQQPSMASHLNSDMRSADPAPTNATALPPRREPQVMEMDVIPPSAATAPPTKLTQPEVHQMLFEQPPAAQSAQTAPSPDSLRQIASALTSSDASDPVLEKATLEELNDALARAFSQIAARNHQA